MKALIAVAALLLGAAAGCGGSSGGWPQPNLDESSTRAVSGPIDAGDVGRLHLVWRFRIPTPPGASGAMTATPVIAGGVVYVQDMKSNVFALELATGHVRWRRSFQESTPGPNGLAVADGRVYGVTDAAAFALSAKTGRVLWSTLLVRPTEQFVETAPLATGGRVYVSTIGLPPNGKGALYEIDARTGAVDWRFGTIERPWRVPSEAGGGGAWYPPSVAGDTVYWGTTNPYPYGGTRRHPNGGAYAGPALYTDSLLALRARSGTLEWYDQVTSHDVRDYDFQLPPVLAGRLVVGAGKAGRVIAWDRYTRARAWIATVGVHRNDTGPLPLRRVPICPGLLGGVETPMAYAHGVVFVPIVDLCMRGGARGYVPLSDVDVMRGRGELVALDAKTGRRLWSDRLARPVFGCATVSNDVVFTSTFDGMLIGVDARDGHRLVTRRLDAGINACPAVAHGTIVVPAGVPVHAGQTADVEAFTTG